MIGLVTLAGSMLVIGISYIVDGSGTVRLVTTAISARGIGWVIKKVIGAMDKDKADLINFTSWAIAGVSIVGLLVNCKKGIVPIVKDIGDTMKVVTDIKADVTGFGEALSNFLDKVTWWE